jgi:hypothetical protein
MKTIRFSCLQKSFERADAWLFRNTCDEVLMRARINMRRDNKFAKTKHKRVLKINGLQHTLLERFNDVWCFDASSVGSIWCSYKPTQVEWTEERLAGR